MRSSCEVIIYIDMKKALEGITITTLPLLGCLLQDIDSLDVYKKSFSNIVEINTYQ